MRKEFILLAIAPFVLTAGAAFAKNAKQPSTAGEINGTYNCELTGGFLAQPDSRGLAQFTVDGKGNVTATAGELNVAVAQHSTSATASNGIYVTSEYIYQICDYSPSGGAYTLGADGNGTLSIEWISHGEDITGGVDCSENITTDFNIAVSSPNSFVLNDTDLNTSCSSSDITYAGCGSNFAGSCQLQGRL